MTDADRQLLELAPRDVNLWAQYYFEFDTMYPWQQAFLMAAQRDRLLVAGIRSGKSLIASLGFLWHAQLYPHSRLLNTSISTEQANIVYQNCLTFCQQPRFARWVERQDRHPYPLIRLINGSEIWFRSIGYEAELIRGFEFDWINVDEAAYVVRKLAIDALKGRLLGVNQLTRQPRAGLFTMTTSPKGRGWLYDRWKLGDPSYPEAEPEHYLSLRVRTYDNRELLKTDAGRRLIEDIRRDYGQRLVEQEFEAAFLDNEAVIFPYEQIAFACNDVHPEVRALNDQIATWRADRGVAGTLVFDDSSADIVHYELPPLAGRDYVQSWDLGKRPTPSGRNAMVGMVWDVTARPFQLVAYRYAPGATYGIAMEWIKEWHRYYGAGSSHVDTVVDATGKGEILNERLEEEEQIPVEGVVYSSATKPALIHAGQYALEKGFVRFPFIKRFVDQLHSYELLDRKLPQDLVMTFCQTMYYVRQRFGDRDEPGSVRRAVISTFRNPGADRQRFVARRKARRA